MESKNRKRISENFVKYRIVEWLAENDYTKHLKIKALREQGVDIKVRHRRYARYFLIETKGQGKIRQADENAFMSSLAQIITRMKIGGSTRYYFGLGLPHTSAQIALRRLPWQVANKLLLYIFSVNKEGKVTQYSWKDLKERQQKQKL